MRFAALMVLVLLQSCDRMNGSGAPAQSAATVTVFAAASTSDVLRQIGERYQQTTGTTVTFSFDASSNLARQIKAGAPADIFISADEHWMDDVSKAGMIQDGSRVDLLGNELVLVAPVGREFEVNMAASFDFADSLPEVKRVAVGDPSHVPAGRYARQALETLGWWGALESKLVPTVDVRAALRLVELGEADVGIVYSTDAATSEKVAWIATFPNGSHEPIRYPAALCTGADAAATSFLDFLRSNEARDVFTNAGFMVLPDTGTVHDSGAGEVADSC